MSITNVFRVYMDHSLKDPLSRFAVCDTPFNCGRRPYTSKTTESNADPTSLHMAAVYCVLRQYELQLDISVLPGQIPLSEEFLEDKKVRQTPFGSITPWLHRKNLEMSPEVISSLHRVYLAVLINQVRHETRYNTGNECAQTFMRIVRQSSTRPTFLAMGTDKVWAVGTSEEVSPDADYPGGNALGEVLSKLAQLMFDDELDTFDGLTIDHLLYVSTFRRPLSGGQSVLILADSGARLIDFIQQGRVFRRGGKTMGEVAEAAENEGIDLRGYRWIIITGFTNDAQKPKHIWESSFARLQSFVGPEIERRRDRARTTILYSLELPLGNIQNSSEHVAWLRERLTSYNVSVQDWSEGCIFVDGNGHRVSRFFEDTIHLNELGTYCLWKIWTQSVDSDLQMMKLRLETKYAAERGEGGTRGDRLRRMSPQRANGIRDRKNKARKRRKTRQFLVNGKGAEIVKDMRQLLSRRTEPEPNTSNAGGTTAAIEIVDNIGKRRRIGFRPSSGHHPIDVVDNFGNHRVVTGTNHSDADHRSSE